MFILTECWNTNHLCLTFTRLHRNGLAINSVLLTYARQSMQVFMSNTKAEIWAEQIQNGNSGGGTNMKPDVDIKIVPATIEEAPALAKFLQDYFFPDEPLNASLRRKPEDVSFLDVLKEGLSFKAINLLDTSGDNLVGVAINKEKSLEQKKSAEEEVRDPKKLKIHKLLKELDERAKIWEVVNNENHFNILCISVNNKYRGHGIGQKLLEESLKLAKSLNYKYASIECSSFYSAKFALALGFELLGEISYEEYLDENQEQIFKVNKPHQAIKKMIKRL